MKCADCGASIEAGGVTVPDGFFMANVCVSCAQKRLEVAE